MNKFSDNRGKWFIDLIYITKKTSINPKNAVKMAFFA